MVGKKAGKKAVGAKKVAKKAGKKAPEAVPVDTEIDFAIIIGVKRYPDHNHDIMISVDSTDAVGQIELLGLLEKAKVMVQGQPE